MKYHTKKNVRTLNTRYYQHVQYKKLRNRKNIIVVHWKNKSISHHVFSQVCKESKLVAEHKHAAPAVAPTAVHPPVVGHPVIGNPVFPASTIALKLAGTAPLHHRVQAITDPHYLLKHRHHKREATHEDELRVTGHESRITTDGPRDGKSIHHSLAPLHAHGPSCQVKIERRCHKVPVEIPHHVEVPHCTRIPRKKCIPSFRTITDTICKDEPREVCKEVEVEVPFDVPIEYCPPIVDEVCEKVPSGQIAHEICH